jgi:DNA-binding transcriptional LysR family regulator
MDRIDAMKVFISVIDEGSLAGAGRRLGRSPAAVGRAIAFLEAHVGAQLLHRTTRSIGLSEVGERYAAACRRVLSDLEEADILAAGDRSTPRGNLTLTAPVAAGEHVLRPIIDEFMDAFPTVSVKLYLLDRPVNFIDEGIDVALRIAHLADSTSICLRLGEMRRVIVASPRYLSLHPMTHFGLDSWSFPPTGKSAIPRTVHFTPRLVVNTVTAAAASASEGHGITRLLSYHVARQIRDGDLKVLLASDEHPPIPIYLLTPQGRLSVPKVRVFVDFAGPRLKAHFGRLTAEAA